MSFFSTTPGKRLEFGANNLLCDWGVECSGQRNAFCFPPFSRTMIFRDIERQIHPQRVINKVVFDLDLIMKQQEPDADDNCLLAVAKEQLKFGHARKPSNSRFVVPRHTEIRYTVIESLSFIRAVIKRRGPEISRGYYERGPRLL